MYVFYRHNTLWEVQNNKPVYEAMNKLYKSKKANFISTFELSTLYTKLPHNKLLMTLNNSTDSCFDGGTNRCIIVSSFVG